MNDPFERLAEEYDRWFDENPRCFAAEVEALRRLKPEGGRAAEVGLGSGRFAQALGVPLGLDPSEGMLRRARQRGIQTIRGRAESLPWEKESFDLILMVTLLCFLVRPESALGEASRVLAPGGHLLLAFLNRESQLGRSLASTRAQHPIYRHARLYAVGEVGKLLRRTGFEVAGQVSVLAGEPGGPEHLQVTHGAEGFFCALLAQKT